MFEAIGRWFDQGASNFRDHLRGAKRKMDDLGEDAAANSQGFLRKAAKVGKGAADVGKGAADATKNAVDAVAKLPSARDDERARALRQCAERRARLPRGGRGALPQARLRLGQEHGFHLGRGMSGQGLARPGAREECTTVTFISRAMCQ